MRATHTHTHKHTEFTAWSNLVQEAAGFSIATGALCQFKLQTVSQYWFTAVCKKVCQEDTICAAFLPNVAED